MPLGFFLAKMINVLGTAVHNGGGVIFENSTGRKVTNIATKLSTVTRQCEGCLLYTSDAADE